MRIRIHRGAHEIGGNCIELEAASGERIVLDVGRPLNAGWDEAIPLPQVAGLADGDPSLLGVLISHPHLDHYGLLGQIDPSVPVWMGQEAARIVSAAAFYTGGRAVEPRGHLEHGVPVPLGPFVVTPFLNDHSAFDAYSLLIEADGRRVFYTGDLRAHGRKASCFEALVVNPPEGVDVLLMEGTHVRPAAAAHDSTEFESEDDLEQRFTDLFRSTAGAVVVCGSAQNLDRLVTVFRAGRRSGRTTVVDLYGATIAAAARPTIPQPGFDGLRVYVPNRQRVLVKRSAEFWRTRNVAGVRVFPEEMSADPGRFTLHVPASTIPELVRAGVLDRSGVAVWSMWEGYLNMSSGQRTPPLLADHQVPFQTIHTSGHASVPDLQRLVGALDPGVVVPIHSEATGRFAEFFPNVHQHADGEWWMA
ncbi:MAG: MBL fold metallo-hydrolase [Actinomycetes bacterium]